MTQNVLLVGATGMLGSQIARELLAQPDTRTRLLLRSSDSATKQAALQPLLQKGAEFVEGDLADHHSLDRATNGIDVIISAVQGGPDVIIDGQVALAEAGKRNGARRILPSDFGLDIFNATPGEHMMFDLRRTADEKISAIGLEQINVLQGAFMDMFRPGAGVIGNDGVATYWGSGTALIDVTTVSDTAKMTARAALDRSLPAGKFAFSGDRISIVDAIAIVEAQTGQHFEHRSLGSEAELRAALATAQEDQSNQFQAVMFAYMLYMLTGQTALTDHQNIRYSDVHLETFTSFAARELRANNTAA
jgi:uncharacterized protein YbjT (DUF2867 family)